jgi:chromatin segregation and condensation protein Rec8/ScpA/Scc1 (kleisin family)
VLELYKTGEADPVQAELFGPIRVARGVARRDQTPPKPDAVESERAIA